jgi:hypothetical protein
MVQDQRSEILRERTRTGIIRANGACCASKDTRSAGVHVGDPRADMFPFFQACRSTQTHSLVRAARNRRAQESEDAITYSLTQARSWPSQESRPFEVPVRHGHQARLTQLQLAFGQMTLLPPRHEPRADKDPVTVWVIRVWEEQARDGKGATGMDLGDLGSHHHTRTSVGVGRVVSASVAG